MPKSGRQDYCTPECKRSWTFRPAAPRNLKCGQCQVDFIATNSSQKFCSSDCRNLFTKMNGRSQRACPECHKDMTLDQATKKFCSTECKIVHRSKQKYSGKEGIDYLICPLCGTRTRQFTPYHVKMHGYGSIQEFALANNIEKITCEVKCQAHAGDKNPGYKHGGKFSPCSKKYVKGYDPVWHQAQIEKNRQQLLSEKEKFKFFIEYWVTEADGDMEKATELYRKFQTRDLSWFVRKYGEEEGAIRHRAKTEKWIKNFKKQNYSKISQQLFNELIDILLNQYKWDSEDIFFAEHDNSSMESYKNKEYFLNTETSYVRPDFLILSKKKIIEFDGDYWHSEKKANPAREKLRDEQITKVGYEVLHIPENKYKTDKQTVIQECINFLMK